MSKFYFISDISKFANLSFKKSIEHEMKSKGAQAQVAVTQSTWHKFNYRIRSCSKEQTPTTRTKQSLCVKVRKYFAGGQCVLERVCTSIRCISNRRYTLGIARCTSTVHLLRISTRWFLERCVLCIVSSSVAASLSYLDRARINPRLRGIAEQGKVAGLVSVWNKARSSLFAVE